MTGTTDEAGAIAAWRDALGEAQVRNDAAALADAAQNVTGLTRRVIAVLTPATTAEVARAVAVAARHAVPLWTYSTGRNWGMGSRLPVRDGAALLDLSRMNRIHAVDLVAGTATVDAGVTQGQLAAHLAAAKSPLFVNVTGSSPATSLIANMLDRGTGFHRARVGQLSDLEVVLGDGRVIRTGYARLPGTRLAGAWRPGLGPELDGLFAQSGFGVVTRGTVELMFRSPAHAILSCAIAKRNDVSRFIEAMANLSRKGVLHAALHFSSRARSTSVVGPLVYRYLVAAGDAAGAETAARARALAERAVSGTWSASCDLSGTKLQVQEAFRQARRCLRGVGTASLVTASTFAALSGGPARASLKARSSRALLAAAQAQWEHACGTPSDAALHSVPWCLPGPFADEVDLDRGRAGTFFVVPAIPLSGPAVCEANAIVDRVSAAAGFVPYTTWNQVSRGALEGVINVVFEAGDAAQAARARRWARDLAEALAAAGFPPYRLGIQDMDLARGDEATGQVVAALGRVLDPAGILSPGRYET